METFHTAINPLPDVAGLLFTLQQLLLLPEEVHPLIPICLHPRLHTLLPAFGQANECLEGEDTAQGAECEGTRSTL